MAKPKYDWTEYDLAQQATAARDLINFLAENAALNADDDEELINDSVEGETTFLEAIDKALDQIGDAEQIAYAIKAREAELIGRRKRFEKRAEALRVAVQMAMLQANGERPLPFSLQTPCATVTVKDGKPKVIIENEADIPAEFFRQPDPVLDRVALNDFVKLHLEYRDGEQSTVVETDEADAAAAKYAELPKGVTLSVAGYSLAIRRK
jgi:hypothetical protein